MPAIKFKIYTLGCKVNQYDARALAGRLETLGFLSVKQGADLAIINTCAVTKTAIIKDQRMIKLARIENPEAKIIVMGCWSKVYKTPIAGVDLLWGVRNLSRLVKKITQLFGYQILKTFCAPLSVNNDRSRYFIKIQDGCRQFCSYCIIPYTRGKLRSRRPAAVIKEITQATRQGYQEIVLSGIHLGLYGVDLTGANKINLTALLKKILAIKGLGRVRLSSIEITEVTDDLIKLLSKNPQLCPHLHISLQSGSDKILKLMHRPYTTGYFAQRVEKLRKLLPHISITTDIIVGFPGETEGDFKDTYKFAKSLKFSKIHVFSFSAHEKTPAFSLPQRVAALEIKKRSAALRELSEKLEKQYKDNILKVYKNKTLAVIVEAVKGQGLKVKTPFYFDLECRPQDLEVPIESNKWRSLVGRLVFVKI